MYLEPTRILRFALQPAEDFRRQLLASGSRILRPISGPEGPERLGMQLRGTSPKKAALRLLNSASGFRQGISSALQTRTFGYQNHHAVGSS